MKRIILIIGAILLGLAVRAQSVTYTCRYWFDQNDAQAVTTTFSEGTWQAELDVGTLIKGLHTLHIQAADTSMAWCSPLNYMFIKMALEEPLLDSVDMTNLTYHCWFDQDHAHQQTGPLGNGSFLFDVSDLEEGLHSVNIMLEGSTLTSTQNYMFIKVAQQEPLIEPIDMSHLVYHCWFDQDYENHVTDSISNGIILLDVENIGDGLHTVHILLEGEAMTSTLTYMFLKKPEPREFGIAKWQYFMNGDVSQQHTTEFSPLIDTLDIITLLPMETWPVRSSCFHFHPNGDAPYLNAKNEVTFRFWSNDDRVLQKSTFYVDYQVQQDIVASVFERNTTEAFAAPRNNQIRWFKLDAVVGDSLAFVADKACTMQLFSPSGEEVYNASGPESVVIGGLHAWEDGTYYLAVHDVMGSGETVSVTYQYLHKYAVLAYDVHLVGNGGCSTITFQGNGFNSLLDVYLVNAQNDTIQRLDIGHESNTTTTVTFNFYQVNLGVYDAVFQFYDETIRINGALEVQEPVDIVLTSSVSYPTTFLRNTACTYTFTITNEGNMTAYAVPIYIYIATASTNSISYIKLEGFKLPSIVEGIDTEFLSDIEIETMHDWANSIDDMHCFNMIRKNIGNEGDSITVRSNYFFITMAPYETKSIILNITSNEAVNVQTTIPDELPTLIPIENESLRFVSDRANNSFSDWYCCVREDYECEIDVASHLLEHAATAGIDLAVLMQIGALITAIPQPEIAAALEAGAGSTFLAAIASSVMGDAVSDFGTIAKITGSVMCDGTGDFLSDLRNAMKPYYGSIQKSVFKAMLNRISLGLLGNDNGTGGYLGGVLFNQVKHWQEMYQAAKEGSDLFYIWLHGSEGAPQCIWKFAEDRPGCPPQPPIGGESNPVNSLDPNDIFGYTSESGSNYMRQEIQNVHYEIEFENDTTLATAAAHTIIVRDTLDATKFDLNSLAARSVTIGDKRLELNGEQTFARTLDMRPQLYVIAQIEQDYDPTTGIVEWTIQSLDPMTMEPTDDPNQGVLPVNYYGNGVGFIDYSINLKEAFPDGTAISNRAGIIFDQNDVIMTPTWTNIVDAVKPTSHIEEVTPVADSLSFSFVSEDNRSGVWYHSLYYRNESTEQEWQVRKAQIFEDSFVLHLEDLLTTEYLVIAVDSAGNREDKDMVAEYIYTASGLHFVTEGNWSAASNWQEGTLPGTDDVAFIDASCQLDQDAEIAALAIADGKTLAVQPGKTLTVNGLLFNPSAEGLVIKDGAQLINASSNVAATLEKDIAAYGNDNPDAWYTIASPMDEMPIEGSSFATPEFDLYRYNESNLTDEEWENYKGGLADFTTFENGRGYLFANSNAFSPAFTGTLNTSAVSCPLSYTERPNDPLSGFNLIGNPFPHDIYKGAGAAIDDANLASGYYTLTNEGTWQVHTYEDAIHPGQGILVKATAPTVLTIAKSTAIATSETGGTKREASPLSISVKGENGQDQAFVYFGPGNSMEKMGGFVAQEQSLWVRDNGKDYAIAHVEKAFETLELCFSSKQLGDFTLTVDRNETEFESLQLVDHVTGLTVDLLKQSTYVFHATGQEPDARFSIRFKVTE